MLAESRRFRTATLLGEGRLSGIPGLLDTGDNVLAVEIHQANLTSSDISFDLELTGAAFGPTPRRDLYFLPVIGAHGKR